MPNRNLELSEYIRQDEPEPCEDDRSIDECFPEVRKMIAASKGEQATGQSGGTMAEDLPTPERSIAQLEKERMERLKQKAMDGQLMLDE